jgi:hypothetical protein
VFDAQDRFIFNVKHQSAAAMVQALALDAAMIIFSVLALGLARKGLPDFLGAVDDGGDGRAADQPQQAADHPASALMQVGPAEDVRIAAITASELPPSPR